MATKTRKTKPEPASIAHRQYGVSDDHAEWCRVVVDFDNRQDSVQGLNGVEVGQYWRNIHVDKVERVAEIRLAGLGTHTAHYESIVLLPEGKEIYDMFDMSGQALWSLREHFELVELVEGEWQRVEPQPFVWEERGDAFGQRREGTYRSERAWVSRVRHDRPQGKPMSWEGKRGTRWNLHENRVLTCDGLVMGTFGGYGSGTYKRITGVFPLAVPRTTTMRRALSAALA